jgi:ankyrin repeat protein
MSPSVLRHLRRAIAAVCVAGAFQTPAAAQTDRRVAEAARRRDLPSVERLVAEGADVRARQGDGATALHWAAHWDDADMARRLISAGADPRAADDHAVTPLWLACLNGSVTMAGLLLEAGADPNAQTAAGETPLMMAAHTGSTEIVRRLLAAGADHARHDASAGQTALMRAVAENHTDAARVLLDAGADPRARSANRFTALLFAAQQGNLQAARLLLDRGAEVSESAPDGIAGDTNAGRLFKPGTDAAALLVAIDSGHRAMARLLLERGADPNHAGAGRTALHSAVQQAMPDVVQALLDHGADPNARLTRPMPALSRLINQQHGLEVTTLGATPFWLAASYGDIEVMRLLTAGGADPTVPANDGTTALMVAAGLDFVEGQDKYGRRWFADNTAALQERARAAVELCLELGLDINAVNERGQSTIFGGVYFRSPAMVQFLVDRGARVDVVNQRGQTPWIVAAKGEYRSGSFLTDPATAALLVALGADTTLGKDLGREFERRPQ